MRWIHLYSRYFHFRRCHVFQCPLTRPQPLSAARPLSVQCTVLWNPNVFVVMLGYAWSSFSNMCLAKDEKPWTLSKLGSVHNSTAFEVKVQETLIWVQAERSSLYQLYLPIYLSGTLLLKLLFRCLNLNKGNALITYPLWSHQSIYFHFS